MNDKIGAAPKVPKKPRRWIGLVATGSPASLVVGRTTNLIEPPVGLPCTQEHIRRWMADGIEVSTFHSALVGTPTVWGGNMDGRQ